MEQELILKLFRGRNIRQFQVFWCGAIEVLHMWMIIWELFFDFISCDSDKWQQHCSELLVTLKTWVDVPCGDYHPQDKYTTFASSDTGCLYLNLLFSAILLENLSISFQNPSIHSIPSPWVHPQMNIWVHACTHTNIQNCIFSQALFWCWGWNV